MVSTILQAYGLDENYQVKAFGSGLINHTWLVRCSDREDYILQKINHQVFKQPWLIDANMQMTATAEHLNIHRNTLDYRIRRIEEITGLRLSTTEDRVRLYLALEMGDA